MTPELKTKWIEALESGDYKKGKSYLKRGDSHCCLGVLCLIDGVSNEKPEYSDAYSFKFSKYDTFTFPPQEYFDSVGLNIDLASVLASINDGSDTFYEVIKKIKEEA